MEACRDPSSQLTYGQCTRATTNNDDSVSCGLSVPVRPVKQHADQELTDTPQWTAALIIFFLNPGFVMPLLSVCVIAACKKSGKVRISLYCLNLHVFYYAYGNYLLKSITPAFTKSNS